MGFWGVFLVARGADGWEDLESVAALDGTTDWSYEGPAGWRFVRLHRADWPDEDQLQAIVDDVAGPVLCAYVADSDMAEVRLAAPDRTVFTFVLNETSAARAGAPVDPLIQGQVAQQVQDWAGVAVDAAAVAEVVGTDAVFVEDAILRLASAFGALPADQLPS